jgi:hypothetical protein
MSDKISVPRTFAGALGAADVMNSVKRKFLSVPVIDSTTYCYGNSTTGGMKFARNATIEKVIVNFYSNGTTTNAKHLYLRIRKNASTAVTSPIYGTTGAHWSATTGWKRMEYTPVSAAVGAFTSSDRLVAQIEHHRDSVSRIAVTIQYLEALDS